MPIYDFECESGHHYSRRVEYGTHEQTCPISRCYARARSKSVYPVSVGHPKFWGGELPREAAEARDEYLAHADNVRTGLAEEEGNGWSPDFQSKTF